jgi:lysozyme
MIPRVIDIYHGNDVTADGFKNASLAGVWAIIHKASQGVSMKDPKYHERKQKARDAGLLFGAYHFNSGDSAAQQADNFLESCKPDDQTLLCLDYEDYSSAMDIDQAVEFIKIVEKNTGKPCAIYSGNRLKESIGQLNAEDFKFITSKKLWLCQYSTKYVLPKGFTKYWLWQYTGDGVGPTPNSIKGFNSGEPIDLSEYSGDRNQLTSDWYQTIDTESGPRVYRTDHTS